jgi:hypothetical protein
LAGFDGGRIEAGIGSLVTPALHSLESYLGQPVIPGFSSQSGGGIILQKQPAHFINLCIIESRDPGDRQVEQSQLREFGGGCLDPFDLIMQPSGLGRFDSFRQTTQTGQYGPSLQTPGPWQEVAGQDPLQFVNPRDAHHRASQSGRIANRFRSDLINRKTNAEEAEVFQ